MSIRSVFVRIVAQPFSWLRAVLRRRHLEAEMEAELANHLENLTADLILSGLPPAEAARKARIELGTVNIHKEGMRASLGLRWWDEFWADLRYGLRILRKSPGFTAIAVTSLALAIGANTTIFSVAKFVLLDRLNVTHADQLRLLKWTAEPHNVVHHMWGEFGPAPGGGMLSSVFSYPVYKQLRDQDNVMQDLFAFKEDSMNATIRGNAQSVVVSMVSGNFYSSLGILPQLGRPIQPSDDNIPSAGAVAVISDELWDRLFARSPAVLGQTIILNQSLFTIVGVNPPGFTGAKQVQISPDIFIPLSMQPLVDPKGKKASLLDDPTSWWLNIMGRTKSGVKDSQARAELNVELATATRATLSVNAGESIPQLDLADGGRGLNVAAQIFQKPVFVLLTLTAFVLLLACANIANLLLARGAHRQREMSVRLALGAGRSRVIRQLLTESLLLSALGGVGGLLFGYLGRNLIPALLGNSWDQHSMNVPIDWGVFSFAAAVTLFTGLLFGLAPALMAARATVSSTLKESAQTTTRRRRGVSGKAIIAFQIALSMLLVIGAGLFLRTLLALNSVDVGFKTDHLILFEVSPPVQRYGPGKDVQLHQRLEQGFATLPGVKGVAPSWTAYLAGNISNDDFTPEGESPTSPNAGAEDLNVVGVDFFRTMGIPIIGGRSFTPQDTATSPKVAIINQALAKKRFPNVNPIGRRFKTSGLEDKSVSVEIVGICADSSYTNLRDPAPPQFFMPYVQQPEVGGLTYAIRTDLKPAELVPALRHVVKQVDNDLPIVNIRTQKEQINANMQMERTFAALASGFGVLALVLACIGIYGIMAYSVANRTNEIGIRLALGAQPAQLRRMILRESTWLAVVGIIAGLATALALARLVKSMLFGIQPYHPLTLSVGVVILLAVALASSWLPRAAPPVCSLWKRLGTSNRISSTEA